MAFVTPTNVTVGSVLTASKYNQEVVDNTIALPRGVMGRAAVTGSQTGITSETNVTGVSVTFTADPTRIYKTTIFCSTVVQLTAQGYATLIIADAANAQKTFGQVLLATNFQAPLIATITETGLSGSTTRKGRAFTTAGTLTLSAGATSPMFIVVEDIGAA
jgi:hypothetical protein